MKEKIKKILILYLYWPWFWKKYTKEEWDNEMKASPVMLYDSASRTTYNPLGSTLPCPKCKKIGFYAARKVDDRKYRACKFCGFWQEVWGCLQSERSRYGKPYRAIHFYCDKCNKIETYDWTIPGAKDLGDCKLSCGGKNKRIKWAINNKSHPYGRLELLS